MFIRLERTPTCDGRTDRQTDAGTDRHRIIAVTALRIGLCVTYTSGGNIIHKKDMQKQQN